VPAVIYNRWNLLRSLLAGACLQLAASSALAQSDKPFAAPQATAHAAAANTGNLVQVTLSLLLVLGAVFVAAWVARRLRGLGRFGTGAITVISEVGLGPKERAVLVQVGGKQLLLGVAPGRVSTLHVLDEPLSAQHAANGSAADAAGAQLAPEFKAILKRSLGLK
jgi:flagellar protein FliO/FliZ